MITLCDIIPVRTRRPVTVAIISYALALSAEIGYPEVARTYIFKGRVLLLTVNRLFSWCHNIFIIMICYIILFSFTNEVTKKYNKANGQVEILTRQPPYILSLSSLRCDICCVTFRTHRGLLRHNALVHKQLPRDAMGRPFIQNNPSIPAGFHDLGFTDFSCRKFPWISQVCWSTRRTGSSLHSLHRWTKLPYPDVSFA